MIWSTSPCIPQPFNVSVAIIAADPSFDEIVLVAGYRDSVVQPWGEGKCVGGRMQHRCRHGCKQGGVLMFWYVVALYNKASRELLWCDCGVM